MRRKGVEAIRPPALEAVENPSKGVVRERTIGAIVIKRYNKNCFQP